MVRERDDGTLEKVVRAKWTMDGSESVDEMVQKLEEKAEYLQELKEDGWELQFEVEDDYAILVREN